MNGLYKFIVLDVIINIAIKEINPINQSLKHYTFLWYTISFNHTFCLFVRFLVEEKEENSKQTNKEATRPDHLVYCKI